MHQYRMMSRAKEKGGQQKTGLVEEGKQPSRSYSREETWVTLGAWCGWPGEVRNELDTWAETGAGSISESIPGIQGVDPPGLKAAAPL